MNWPKSASLMSTAQTIVIYNAFHSDSPSLPSTRSQ